MECPSLKMADWNRGGVANVGLDTRTYSQYTQYMYCTVDIDR